MTILSLLDRFLQQFGDATVCSQANWEDISKIISPLGLGTKRAKALVRFSAEYLALTKENDAFNLGELQVRSLFGVGEYSWNAYELFILQNLPVNVQDHALVLYVDYQIGKKMANREDVI